MTTKRALKSYAKHYLAYDHPSKGTGKRAASKARRRLGKAFSDEEMRSLNRPQKCSR